MKTQLKKSGLLLVALSAALLASGCGGSAYRDYNAPTGTSQELPTDDGDTTGTTNTSFFPTIANSFTLTGVGGEKPIFTTAAISTDNILRIRIRGGSAKALTLPPGGTYNYSNFSAPYGCISFTVSIAGDGQETETKMLKVGDSQFCSGAVAEDILDFSNRLVPGHGKIKIQVSQPTYDWYCRAAVMWPGLYNPYGLTGTGLYCPMHTVYKTHTVSGSMDIQTNGSSL